MKVSVVCKFCPGPSLASKKLIFLKSGNYSEAKFSEAPWKRIRFIS